MRVNTSRAETAIKLIWSVMILDIVFLGLNYFQLVRIGRLEDDIYYEDASDFIDYLELFVGLFYSVVYITSVVMFIRWFRRAYYNLHLISPSVLKFKEGWAAGSWFVPILNLFRPYQIMKELYIETNSILLSKIDDYKNKDYLKYIGIWWTFWVITNFLSNRESSISFRADTVQSMETAYFLGIITSLLGIPLSILAVKVIKEYSIMETKLYSIRHMLKGAQIDYGSDEQVLDTFG